MNQQETLNGRGCISSYYNESNSYNGKTNNDPEADNSSGRTGYDTRLGQV